jgi:hypothetical protein
MRAVKATVFAALTLAGACRGSAQADDLAPLYRAAKTLQVSADVGVSYQTYGDLVRALAVETELAHKTHPSPTVDAFDHALEAYRDALAAWDVKIKHSDGAVFNDPPLIDLAKKYNVPSVRIVGATSYYSPDAVVQAAWRKASTAVGAAEAAYLGRPH